MKVRKERKARMGGWLETAVFYLFISVDGEKRGNAESRVLSTGQMSIFKCGLSVYETSFHSIQIHFIWSGLLVGEFN